MYDSNGLEILTAEDCLKLLSSVTIGRVVCTDNALPAVLPVRFRLLGEAVVICASESSTLAAAVRNAVVAFQADWFAPDDESGWSVTVVGYAREVTDPADRARLAELPVRSWMPGDRDCYLRIPAERVTGRRLG
ncbi:MAG TPA: pyridoxamine 5'-phosphate oxidase family protein [Mycobacteriales bacterium]|nr:pyridoxamine 5'-phosphate oxidase family protein [Mycobacteriales bacterium]